MKFLFNKGNADFFIENVTQVINMGGPWVGDLYRNSTLISAECVVDNFLWDGRRLFFLKYYSTNGWANGMKFKVNFYNLEENVVYEAKRYFSIIYLKSFYSDRKIELLEAFWDMPSAKKIIFDIEKESFNKRGTGNLDILPPGQASTLD